VLRNLRQVLRFVVREDAEDGLERAVAARAMQAELVALAAAGGQSAVRRTQGREGRNRIGRTHRRQRLDQQVRVTRAAARQRRNDVGVRRRAVAAAAVEAPGEGLHLGRGEAGHVHDLEPRRRIAQEPMRPHGEAGGDGEA